MHKVISKPTLYFYQQAAQGTHGNMQKGLQAIESMFTTSQGPLLTATVVLPWLFFQTSGHSDRIAFVIIQLFQSHTTFIDASF